MVDVGGTNNITGDPLFTDLATNDFHILTGSPAIGAADPQITNSHDFDGTPRPPGTRSDIGAYVHAP